MMVEFWRTIWVERICIVDKFKIIGNAVAVGIIF